MTGKGVLRHIVSIVAILLISALLTAGPGVSLFDSFAYEGGEGKSKTVAITYPFLDTAKVAYEWSFPYNDDFFETDPGVFDREFARGSLGFAASAFRSTKNTVEPQYETYLTGAGFTGLYAFGYDEETTQDSLSGIIGMKKVGDSTVIAAVTCGQGYGKEWAGNLKVGDGDVHEGFRYGADLLETHIDKYILDNNISGDMKLWLTGISRAAAIANLTAADAIESGDYKAVYAYLFGVPRTTKNPVDYKGIYNICGQFDPVCSVPLESWGFYRHGTDIYTPAQESDTQYFTAKQAASEVAEELAGDHYRNNPEINYQLQLILEFIGKFFPTNEAYADRFQEILMETWKEASIENIVAILSVSLSRIDDLNKKEEDASKIFLDYVSYAIGKHTRADTYGVDDGNWNPDEGLDANVVIEHRPSTYVKWLFADFNEDKVFHSGIDYRRLMINGTTDIEIYENGSLVRRVVKLGVYKLRGYSESDIYVQRDGNNTKICLPMNGYYMLKIKTDKLIDFTLIDSKFRTGDLYASDSDKHYGKLAPGEYTVDVNPGQDIGRFSTRNGLSTVVKQEDYRVSTRALMREELDGVKGYYISFSRIKDMFKNAALLALIILIVTLIVEGVNLYWKNSLGDDVDTPPAFLICATLVMTAIFVWQTMFAMFYLYSVPKARTMTATLALFTLFFLGLRGLLRTKDIKSLPFVLMMLALSISCIFYYKDIKVFNEFSLPQILLFPLAVMLLAAMMVYFCWQPSSEWFRSGRYTKRRTGSARKKK